MGRTVYFDCFSGASGDMILGALVDAGLSFDALVGEIDKLGLPPNSFRLSAGRVTRGGIAATKVDVSVTVAPTHRTLDEVLAIVYDSSLPQQDREQIAAVFTRLGEAEARVHGTSLDETELHDVGAVDAIVDVTGAVTGLRLLGVEAVYCSEMPMGSGKTRSRHGVIPVPAPATLELVASARAPIMGGSAPGEELVTPTGAAILTTLARFERPTMRIERAGYGAGGRDSEEHPNVLRVWLGSAVVPARLLRQVETNIDDSTPEILGYVQELLLKLGAADVWFTPIQMKKNRPGTLLSVLCDEALESEVVETLLRETSTLGVRVRPVSRFEAARETFEFESTLGPAAVKVKRLLGRPPRVAPEYEACRRLAEARLLPIEEVYRIITREAEALLNG